MYKSNFIFLGGGKGEGERVGDGFCVDQLEMNKILCVYVFFFFFLKNQSQWVNSCGTLPISVLYASVSKRRFRNRFVFFSPRKDRKYKRK